MQPSLDDLLRRWVELRASGVSVSVPALCPDLKPEDAAELERRIRRYEALEKIVPVPSPTPEPPSGDVPLPQRIGRFPVQELLGVGGCGLVYKVWDANLERAVALKVLRPSLPVGAGTEARWLAKRFEQEAKTLARLKHQHIVPIHEGGLHDGEPYFVMEYVTGGSLLSQRASLTAAGPGEVVSCLEKVARAVAYAHDQGVLHCDLKPGNILLDAKGSPLVSDFGLAMLFHPQGAAATPAGASVDTPPGGPSTSGDATVARTDAGYRPGTPPYMAPEQLDASFGRVGPAADIWALGVILYELLAGRRPFPGPEREQYREQVCGGEFPRPRAVCPRLSRRIEAVILRCLAPSAARRYPSAAAVADALADCRRRRRWPWLAVAAVALASVTGVLLAWLRPKDPEQDYRSKVASAQRRLEQDGMVELISADPGKSPAFVLRRGQDGTAVKPVSAGGLTVYTPSPCCLIELLPDVGVPNYRIRARLRRRPPLNTLNAKWGVYCQHRAVVTAQGGQHYFNAAYFSGSDEMKKDPRLTEYTIMASLCPRLFGDLERPPGEPPHRDWAGVEKQGDGSKTFHQRLTYPPSDTPPRTDVEVTVRGNLITAISSLVGGNQVADKLCVTPDDQSRSKVGVLADPHCPDLAGISPDQLTGTGLGIFVSEVQCVVENFVVEKIGDR